MSDSPLAIRRRIVVTGLAGSGKRTFAVALANKTGLPAIDLDLGFWKPGWVASSETEWRQEQSVALAGEAWIADSARALRRGFTMRGQLPEGYPHSARARWRDEWRLAGRILRERHVEPAREREVIANHGQGVAVHVLRSPAVDLLHS